jgi:predicted nucleotidyltransferase
MSSQLHPPANLTPLCQDLRQALSALYGEQLTHLILFGSYARQTATADSDIDIAVAMCNRAEASQKASLDSAFQ